MGKQKNYTPIRLSSLMIDEIGKTVRTFLRCCTISVCVWLFTRILPEIAGTETSILVSFLADWKVLTSLGVGFAGLGWGYIERRNRHKTVTRLSQRILELERRIDPNRTSTNLTAAGKTNPEDTDL